MRISDWSSDVCSSDLLVGMRLGRTLGHARMLLDQIRCWRRLHHKSEGLVSKSGNHNRNWHAWLNTLGLRVERLAEFHDVQTTLTQSRSDWRGWICFTSWHLQDRKSTRLNSSH